MSPTTAVASPPPQVHTNTQPQPMLNDIVRAAQPGVLRPLSFFPAWQGVLTLAFSGFPASLKDLKKKINESLAITKESPGSMWPKVSLGVLKEGTRLTPEMLACVLQTCSEASEAIWQSPPDSLAVKVDQLDVVVYECRSLERQISSCSIPLLGCSASVNEAAPSAEEAARVQAIVDEAKSPDYWFCASKDGNREMHYRSSAVGVSLVHHSGSHRDASGMPAQHPLLPIIHALQQKIEEKLPGMYTFFEDKALHCTFRAIAG